MISREGEKLYNDKFPEKALLKESERTTDRLDQIKELIIRLAGIIPTTKDLEKLKPEKVSFPDEIKVSNIPSLPEVQKVEVSNIQKIIDDIAKSLPKEKTKKTDKLLAKIIKLLENQIKSQTNNNQPDLNLLIEKLNELQPQYRETFDLTPITQYLENLGQPASLNQEQFERLSTLLMNIGNAFVGKASEATLQSINDNITSSLSKYHITDQDTSGTTQYFGFTDKDGAWYIMAIDTSTNSYRYSKGDSDYTTAWSNRASETYDYYYNIF